MKREINFASLKRFNLVMGLLHFIQGGIMLFAALNITKIADFKISIQSYFLAFDTTQRRLVTLPKELGLFPFGIYVSVFLFLSAAFHFLIVTKKGNQIYNKNLEKGMNPFRWYEYALSSSLMIILVAMLFGVYDIGSLMLMFGLNASMNLFGLLMEKINQYTKKTDWSSFIFGTVAGIIPWIVITMYAFGNADPGEVPWFVYAVFSSYFVFFNLFPINMIFQYCKVGKWSNYIYGERVYIILSLVAKSVLAWLVFFGAIQPQ